jgi:NFACT protein RNA binding domain
MDAPLLLALARARLRGSTERSIESLWVSPRALGLRWAARGRSKETWILLLQPQAELWSLSAGHAALELLTKEANPESAKQWGAFFQGARLMSIEGDPRERWLGLLFQRRTISGKLETLRVSFQAIPGRAGIRVDGVDVQVPRLGVGTPFPLNPTMPLQDPPSLIRWRERWGDQLDAALKGDVADVLGGEGPLLARHLAWSESRADALILAPSQQALLRVRAKESQRLERLAKALEKDRAKHQKTLTLKSVAQRLAAELYRLKGASGEVDLLDGSTVKLPKGKSAEDTAQLWFAQGKKAERGLSRIQELEMELERERTSFEQSSEGPPSFMSVHTPEKPEAKKQKESKRMNDSKRKDGKGAAFRSVMIDDFEILIGKGDAENDQLTFKVADDLDFWLHVANMPGSHVVIRNPDKLSDLPRAVIERAAELAAYHSKARESGKTEVHLARIADISKPRGYAPGKVILKKWTSLRVYPKP